MASPTRSPWLVRAVGSPGGMVADPAEVRRAVALFADPVHGFEVVALKSGVHTTLPGSDVDGICAAVDGMPGGAGVYFRYNPVPLGLPKQAKNDDVISRRWVYVDCDPVKPEAFKDDSATDAEKAKTWGVAGKVHAHLEAAGWPEPAVVDTGNGHALFYPADLPNDRPTQATVRKLLNDLSERFSGEDGVVDKAVHNANRLTKVPGTWARKGTHTTERPHRPCRLMNATTRDRLVTPELLARTVDGVKELPAPPPAEANGHAWSVRAGGSASPAEAYAQAALDAECERVANETAQGGPHGGRNGTLNRAAFSLGQLIGGGVLGRAEVEGRLYEAACRCGLDADPGCGVQGIRATIASGIEAGLKEPRGVPEPAAPRPKWQPATAKKDTDPRPTIYRLPELMGLDLPAPRWAIPGLLSEGLSILAGKPKLGKSWMALNLALTVAAGGKALGNIRVQSGDVIYLALEDRLRRIRDRARKVLGGLKEEPPGRLCLAVEWRRQHQGGVHDLADWLDAAADPRLVVIDVWAKFRSPAKTKGSAYEQDYDQLSEVKSLADHYGASVLAVHHTRKGAAEDVFDEISGTLGIAGAADGAMVLARSRGANEGTLALTGRDIEEQTLAVQFDPETFVWTSLGNAEQRFTGELQKKIVDYLRSEGSPRFVADIAAHLGKSEKTEVEAVRTVVKRLAEAKVIRRVNQAYAFPGEGGDQGEHWADK